MKNRVAVWPVMVYVVVTMIVALYGVSRSGLNQYSVFDLANLVGPTVRSFVATGTMESLPGYYGARMPIATLYVALGYITFGDEVPYIILSKVWLVIAIMAWISWLVFRSRAGKGVNLELLGLLVISASSYTVANIINIQVEEAYGFAAFALCWAMLLYRSPCKEDRTEGKDPRSSCSTVVVFACSAAVALLSKSSFVLSVVVLMAAFGYRFGLRRFFGCVSIVCLFGLAWASYQYTGSGRFTLGTSLDGWNLYKGNNQFFLERYPPPPGTSLDVYDDDLFKDSPSGGEWIINDYYRDRSLRYIADNPGNAFDAFYRKFLVCFFSVEKYGSTSSEGVRKYYELSSMVLFRLVFWLSLAAAALEVFTQRRLSLGFFYILFVGALLLPYLVGFAYTRHVSVLALPSVLFLLYSLRRAPIVPSGTRE